METLNKDASVKTVQESKEFLKKTTNLFKISNKMFKALYGPTMHWDSRNNGTYNYGKNASKRAKKQAGK
jgi:hypothetical protein